MKTWMKFLWKVFKDILWVLFQVAVYLLVTGGLIWGAVNYPDVATGVWTVVGVVTALFVGVLMLLYLSDVYREVRKGDRNGR